MNSRKKKIIIIISIVAVAVCAATACMWGWCQGLFLPRWITWREKTVVSDDGQLVLSLEERTLTAAACDTLIWESPAGVAVSDYLWCDIDHDEAPELMLLCWRRGRFGSARPFWVEADEQSWSQHIYIYDWTGKSMMPVWMASDIGMDAVDWTFDETERLVITETSGRRTGWDWVSWGLTLIRTYE